jgi:uroporphyrin-III C-methyltransferase/precorrin-2 dehydrogenase/sirohydrochlorin ferrochelatase
VSTIGELPAVAEKEQPEAPTLVIIGEVVKLHDDLAWFHP